MQHGWSNHAYEVVLAPAAIRVIRRLPNSSLGSLAEALLTELVNGPNARSEVRFGQGSWAEDQPADQEDLEDWDDRAYTATPLSFDGYTAIHRPMTIAELERLSAQEARPAASFGFYVIDLLPPESAFRRWPRHA